MGYNRACIFQSLLLLFVVSIFNQNDLFCQTLFRNVNHELCIALYISDGAFAPKITYLVITNEQPLLKNDSIILKKWNTLNRFQQSLCTQQWSTLGYRVEIENYPCVQHKFKFQPFLK